MIGLPWLLAIGGTAAGLLLAGVQTVRMDNAKAGEAATKLEFADFKTSIANQNLALVQAQQDRERAAFDKLTSAMQSIGAVGQQTKTEVRLVQSSGGPCSSDPAYLAMFDGLDRVRNAAAQGGPGGDKNQGGPKVPTALRTAGTPVPK